MFRPIEMVYSPRTTSAVLAAIATRREGPRPGDVNVDHERHKTGEKKCGGKQCIKKIDVWHSVWVYGRMGELPQIRTPPTHKYTHNRKIYTPSILFQKKQELMFRLGYS